MAVVKRICVEVDRAFRVTEGLAERYPHSLAADGRSSFEVKSFVPERMGYDLRYAVDDRRARAELGYSPCSDFADGMAQTVGWYLANERWWQPLRKH